MGVRVWWGSRSGRGSVLVGVRSGGGQGLVGVKVWWGSRSGGGQGLVGVKVWWGSRSGGGQGLVMVRSGRGSGLVLQTFANVWIMFGVRVLKPDGVKIVQSATLRMFGQSNRDWVGVGVHGLIRERCCGSQSTAART